MNTWGRVQLCRVMWDSYVRIPIFVTREISNNRFIILEPILLIASKRWVTHYPRVTKKEKKKKKANGHNHQPNKQSAFASLKGYIFAMSIWGSCLKTSLGGLRLLFAISIFTCSGKVLALGWHWSLSLSLPLLLCLHIQFPQDMCTSGPDVLTCEEVLGGRSTRENDLLRTILVTYRRAFLVVLTYDEVFDGM